jgi:hypothetical protein
MNEIMDVNSKEAALWSKTMMLKSLVEHQAAKIERLRAALHKIAHEQIGPAAASYRYVLDACVDIAVAALVEGERE